jgi:hypothetical protein
VPRLADVAARLRVLTRYPQPTLLNNCPHPREVRQHFYGELTRGVLAAVKDGKTRMRSFQQCVCPVQSTRCPALTVASAGSLRRMWRWTCTGLARCWKVSASL